MRPRWPVAAASLAAVAVLLAACVEREDTPPTPTAVTRVTATAVTPAPAATEVGPLDERDVAELLRRAVCWHDDPSMAASCLPPQSDAVEAIQTMGLSGDARFIAPLIDMRWLDVGWDRWVEESLEAITGERFEDPLRWYEWAGTREPELPEGYGAWKGRLLSLVDPAFVELLDGEREYALRLDLLIWAGVGVDEVTALREPSFVHRVEERYLNPDDTVYGLLLNGEARAYPRRIVAWHELVMDEIDDEPVLISFCRSCGGAIAYDPRTESEQFDFGTSGLLYDARPLLFDEQTKSLWDAFTGRPVAGELLDAGLNLARYVLITTTWEDWSTRHPNTLVLDLDTGYVRDYSPGTGLRDELDTDGPTSPSGELDPRLPPKERVLGLTLGGEARAYAVERVRRIGMLQDTVGDVAVTLISEGPGTAIRVYRSAGLEVSELTVSGGDLIAIGDDGGDGTRWFVQEAALVSTTDGRRYLSVPRVEAYWYTWSDAHPETTIWDD